MGSFEVRVNGVPVFETSHVVSRVSLVSPGGEAGALYVDPSVGFVDVVIASENPESATPTLFDDDRARFRARKEAQEDRLEEVEAGFVSDSRRDELLTERREAEEAGTEPIRDPATVGGSVFVRPEGESTTPSTTAPSAESVESGGVGAFTSGSGSDRGPAGRGSLGTVVSDSAPAEDQTPVEDEAPAPADESPADESQPLFGAEGGVEPV